MSDYEAWWLKAMGENRELRTDLERVRQQRDVVIEHEHVMTTEIEGLLEALQKITDSDSAAHSRVVAATALRIASLERTGHE